MAIGLLGGLHRHGGWPAGLGRHAHCALAGEAKGKLLHLLEVAEARSFIDIPDTTGFLGGLHRYFGRSAGLHCKPKQNTGRPPRGQLALGVDFQCPLVESLDWLLDGHYIQRAPSVSYLVATGCFGNTGWPPSVFGVLPGCTISQWTLGGQFTPGGHPVSPPSSRWV